MCVHAYPGVYGDFYMMDKSSANLRGVSVYAYTGMLSYGIL